MTKEFSKTTPTAALMATMMSQHGVTLRASELMRAVFTCVQTKPLQFVYKLN